MGRGGARSSGEWSPCPLQQGKPVSITPCCHVLLDPRSPRVTVTGPAGPACGQWHHSGLASRLMQPPCQLTIRPARIIRRTAAACRQSKRALSGRPPNKPGIYGQRCTRRAVGTGACGNDCSSGRRRSVAQGRHLPQAAWPPCATTNLTILCALLHSSRAPCQHVGLGLCRRTPAGRCQHALYRSLSAGRRVQLPRAASALSRRVSP